MKTWDFDARIFFIGETETETFANILRCFCLFLHSTIFWCIFNLRIQAAEISCTHLFVRIFPADRRFQCLPWLLKCDLTGRRESRGWFFRALLAICLGLFGEYQLRVFCWIVKQKLQKLITYNKITPKKMKSEKHIQFIFPLFGNWSFFEFLAWNSLWAAWCFGCFRCAGQVLGTGFGAQQLMLCTSDTSLMEKIRLTTWDV